jgi:uncharacterized membrane protein
MKSSPIADFTAILFAALALVPSKTTAQPPGRCTFLTIDYPGAASTAARSSTWLRINDQGNIGGGYEDASGKGHGFLFSNGIFLTVDGFDESEFGVMNSRGDVLGDYIDDQSNLFGYLMHRGSLTKIVFPDAVETSPNSINEDGTIVGYYTLIDGRRHGYVLRDGIFNSFDAPNANFTVASAINNLGTIVGIASSASALGPELFVPGNTHGYVLRNGQFTLFDVPGAVFTVAIDVNSHGAIVGRYNTPDGKAHGYLLEHSRFSPIDVPGSALSFATGINSHRDIVGKYQSTDGIFHGYLLKCSGR